MFWSLATISLAWTMGQLALRRAELGEFFGELIRYLLFTGFWAWMLSNGPAHAQLIMESMVRLAGNASGQNMMSPSAVVDVGFHLVDRALTQSTILSPLDSAFGIVLSLVILVVLTLVGVNMLVVLIACWIVAYGGLIVLGFGGSRWTSDMATHYYRMVLSLALEVMAMVLLVGVGQGFLQSYYKALGQDVSLHEQAVLLVVSIVLLATVNRVPALLGSLANGASPQYALGAGAGPGAALSTAGAATALATSSTRPAFEMGGKLAKAGAMAAIGSGAAVASLLNAFRSRDDGSSTPRDGGSVFPAPVPPYTNKATASAPVPQTTLASAPPFGRESVQRSAQQGQQTKQPKEPGEGKVQAAAKTIQSELVHSRTVGTQPEVGAQDGSNGVQARAERIASGAQMEAGGTEASGPALDAREQPPQIRGGATTAASVGKVSDPAAPPDAPAPEATVSTSASASEQSAATIRDSAAASPTVLASASSPASTFMSPLPSRAAAAAVPSGSAVASPPTAPTGQATPTPAQPGAAPAPLGAFAAAAVRTIVLPHDLSFSSRVAGEGPKAPKPPTITVPAPAAERAELPAAYGAETRMDIEAEVAAFRDKE